MEYALYTKAGKPVYTPLQYFPSLHVFEATPSDRCFLGFEHLH